MKLPWVLLLLLGIGQISASASETGVLIDRSGSMKSHYLPVQADRPELTAPLVRQLAASMARAASVVAKPDLAVFDTTVEPLSDLENTTVFQYTTRDTLLTAALQSALKKHRYVWLLTDNVQDFGSGNTDMSDFYALLHSPEIKHIRIFPVLERADLGQSGVLVYAISTVDDTRDFDRQIAEFHAQLEANPRLSALHIQELLMKPLGTNAIEEIPERVNGPLEFKEGDQLQVQVKVQIRPKYPYLNFRGSDVGADQIPGNESHTAHAFHETPCLDVERKTASVSPSRVQTDQLVEYTVKVDYGRIRLRKSLPCIWAAAFVTSQVHQQIDTPLTVRVPKGNFQFTQSFLDEFSSDTPNDPRAKTKISGLKPLPQELADEVTLIPLSVPVRVVIHYPSWPAIVLVLIAVLVIGAIAGALWLIGITTDFTRSKVSVVLDGGPANGTALKAEVKDGSLWIDSQRAGQVQQGNFVPAMRVRLDSGLKSAPTNAPIHATLADGRKVLIRFGVQPAQRARSSPFAAAASRPTGRPRPTSAPRRR